MTHIHNAESTERLCFEKPEGEHALTMAEFEKEECKPTYEQLSQSSINLEANKNVVILKSFETILQERVTASERFLGGFSKTAGSFEYFQHSDGSLRQAYDALFVYVEQELQVSDVS